LSASWARARSRARSRDRATAAQGGLLRNRALRALSLSGNPLGEEGGVAIAEALECGNTSLARLMVPPARLRPPASARPRPRRRRRAAADS